MSKYFVFPLLMALTAGWLPSVGAEPEAPVTYLDQGWKAADRQQFYTTPQGSLLIPYSWFLHLEQASSEKPFRANEHMDRLRFLPGTPDEQSNPDGLPVGFTKEPTDQLQNTKADLKLLQAFMGRWGKDEADFPTAKAWLGLTCAACHTGQIEVKGKRLRIDGGPAMSDFNRFIRALAQAVEATLEEKPKFTRFANNVLGKEATPAARDALRNRLAQYSAAFTAFVDRNSPQLAHGYGRVDAIGVIMNEVLGTALKVPANYRAVDAPVCYPELWYAPKLDWVQWNGSVANPFARNVGEVLGVFGHTDTTNPMADGYPSSVRGKNLYELEQLIDKLKPPTWDETVLGKLDPEKVKRGEVVYKTAGCATCHGNKAPYPMTASKLFIKTTMVPLKKIGTDPKAATNFAKREALPGIFGRPGDRPMKGPDLLNQFVRHVVLQQFGELQLTPEQVKAYNGSHPQVDPPNLLAYKAKPLAGIWATAPYLHNGSVPSLDELFKPPVQRVKTFYTGSREFDPKTVGFKTAKFEGGFLFDASLPGNSNSGHNYGTECTEAERSDLLEYLKTL